VAELNPAYVLVEAQGLGYHINISLNTYGALQGQNEIRLFTYHFIKADKTTNIPVLFGFAEEMERSLFEKLISVSGVGPNTARVILSSYDPSEISSAIMEGNELLLKSIKGVGPKAAQRLILELKDKLNLAPKNAAKSPQTHNTDTNEALSALVMLGFNRTKAQNAVNQIVSNNPKTQGVEFLIKEALKIL
jgi:Holliday junction DNA helicase RuvA